MRCLFIVLGSRSLTGGVFLSLMERCQELLHNPRQINMERGKINTGENIAIAFPYMSYYSEFDTTKNENISHATVDNSKKLDKDYNLGKEIVGLWMASDEHKKNILKDSKDYGLMPGYKSLAVGTYIDKNGWIYAVQIFGIDDESK